MPNIIRAAAAQLTPDLETPGGTVSKVLNAIAEAGGKGVNLIVFPETFVPWYPYFSFVYPPVSTSKEHIRLYEHAVVVPDPVTNAVAAAARRHNIVVVLGVNERDHGSLYNTQLLFDSDGSLKLSRRKITPTFHERMIWGQGDGSGLKVVDTAAGRVGALACWEHYNPLAATPSWRSTKKSTSRSSPAPWSARFSPNRSRSPSATTRWKADASSSTPPDGSPTTRKPRSPPIQNCTRR
jgi:nitrilase